MEVKVSVIFTHIIKDLAILFIEANDELETPFNTF